MTRIPCWTVGAWPAGSTRCWRPATPLRPPGYVSSGSAGFSAWLTEEGEFDVDPLLGAKAPKLDRTVIEPLTETQLKALLKACAGPDMRDRRDEAILRLMLESVSTVEVSSSRWVPLPVPYRRSLRFPLNLLKKRFFPDGLIRVVRGQIRCGQVGPAAATRYGDERRQPLP